MDNWKKIVAIAAIINILLVVVYDFIMISGNLDTNMCYLFVALVAGFNFFIIALILRDDYYGH